MDRPSDTEILAIMARGMQLLREPGGMQLVEGFSEELTNERPTEKSLFPAHRDLAFIEQLRCRVQGLEYLARLLGDEFAVLWGKATAAWTTGNTVTLDPCTFEGVDLAGAANVTAYLVSPSGDAPDSSLSPEIALNDVLAYVPFTDAAGTLKGVIVNAKWIAAELVDGGKWLDVWVDVQAGGTKVLSTDDWRGRNLLAWASIYSGTPTDALPDKWDDDSNVASRVGSAGATWDDDDDEVGGVTLWSGTTWQVVVYMAENDGTIKMDVSYSSRIQVRVCVLAGPAKSTVDMTLTA